MVKSWRVPLRISLYSSFLFKTPPLDPHRLLVVFMGFIEYISTRSRKYYYQVFNAKLNYSSLATPALQHNNGVASHST